MRACFVSGVAVLAACVLLCAAGPAPGPRSPVAVALLADGRRALTANHASDSCTLVDLEAGAVLAEASCGRKPAAVAAAPDGRRAAVASLWSSSVTLLEVGSDSLKEVGQVDVGAFPRALLFSRDGRHLYVAAQEQVLEVSWQERRVQQRWPAPREPHALALSPDGRWLAAASSRSSQVRCWDLTSGSLHWQRVIEDAFNLRGLAFASDGRAVLCSHVVRRDFPVSKHNIEEGWVTDSRITRLALEADVVPASWQIALDVRGQAVGDPDGLAHAGAHLALAAAGTHELLILETAALPWNAGDPGDFLDPRLLEGQHLRRVPLGGRPLGVAALSGNRVVVANYLLDALQVVDLTQAKLRRSIPLGPAAADAPARRGEALFYDAGRSHNQWFSCHTCHVDGHTCGLSFDTLNDESYGTPKLTPSLHNVARTGPWTWHGRHKDLGAAVHTSLTTTMFGAAPTPSETAALVAFLETLTPPPHPDAGAMSAEARRGQELFHSKAGCSRCHRLPYYTTSATYGVGRAGERSPGKLWNPPSLLGVYQRGPYLHDGRAATLQSLLERHHTPQDLGGDPLTATERAELVAFLLSL